MDWCEATREALLDENMDICPECNRHRVSHLNNESLLKKLEINAEVKKIEITTLAEVKKFEITTLADAEVKKLEITTLADLKKVETELERMKINPQHGKKKEESSSSFSAFSTPLTAPNDAKMYTQIYRNTLERGVKQVELNLSTYGSRSIHIKGSDSTKEGDICSAMALIIENELADRSYYTVSSSQSFGWLPDSNNGDKIYKPDLVICSAAFLTAKSQTRGKKDQCPAVPIGPKFVKFILEAKNVSLGDSELGQLVFYLGLLNRFQTISCGIVFNASNFVYMESSHGAVSCIEWGLLAQPGSLDYILAKIVSVNLPNIINFDNALKHAVESIPLEPFSMTSSLGHGRFGTVHSTVDENGNPCAIKLIELGEHICFADVRNEYEKLKTVYELDPGLTLKIRSDLMHFRTDDVELCAYVMEGVGFAVDKTKSMEVIEMLCELHGIGIIHGDPRLKNIIFLDQKLHWIDFRGNLDFTKELIVEDVRKLLKSIFWERASSVVDKTFEKFS